MAGITAERFKWLGDCYLADYINLEECLDLSLPIAKKLQSAFTSWEELADSYIYGYAFWQNETADDVETKVSNSGLCGISRNGKQSIFGCV